MKYRLTDETKEWFGRTLHRIEALKSFGDMSAGEKGGWIEKEENLSQEGSCWVSGDARVCGDALVSGNAQVYGNAQVSGDAWVSGNAQVYGNAQVCGNAWVFGNAQVYGNAQVSGDAWVSGNAQVYGNAQVCGNARVYDDAQVKSVEDIFCIAGLGSRYGTTTIYRNDGGITVVCGCFLGTLEEFEAKVKETHGGNLYGREYLKLIELAKLHFEVEG